MSPGFWIRRFLLLYLAALLMIVGGQLLRGRAFDDVVGYGLFWALVTASVYTGALFYRRARCRHRG
ncbi:MULTISPECIES: hypothetical protein [unclassified Microbulbifer]|uniref:hypothetical protein n=1 Tax=unclassified Microbulbifer TaxID=2619833 RepID=UPI0027E51FE2|nr:MULTISPECIES: hypothetical protein [unclassified Microbulbifer]